MITAYKDLKADADTVVTVGTFDGIHLGHRAIIDALLKMGKRLNAEPVVVTFDPHPQAVVGPKKGKPIRILTPTRRKIELLKAAGVARVIVLRFDPELANMEYDRFIRNILLEKLRMKGMVVGHDHALGKGRKGRWEEIKTLSENHGFEVHRVAPFSLDDERVSSTVIRNNLEEGRAAAVAMMLGRYFRLTGTVVEGEKRGRAMQFPTANIRLHEPMQLIPRIGVYAAFVEWQGKRLKGMLNIGKRPTFDGTDVTIEVNIFDFDQLIYGDVLTVELVRWLREEKRFDGPKSLIRQLAEDRKQCIEILS